MFENIIVRSSNNVILNVILFAIFQNLGKIYLCYVFRTVFTCIKEQVGIKIKSYGSKKQMLLCY